MKRMIAAEHLNFTYANGGENCLKDISFCVNQGEFIVLCGRSGCGKTTLTRALNGLIPHFYEGTFSGSVRLGEFNIPQADLSGTARLIGSVFQNPASQFFHIDTDGELAFGCENLAMEPDEIRRNVERSVKTLRLEALTGRSLFELSGGEKQQIACGSVYAANPKVYVLDEPSSNLDAKAISRLKATLRRLKEMGKTIIISEHRLYYLMDLADRFFYMEQGRISHIYKAEEMKAVTEEERVRLGLRTFFLEQSGLSVDPCKSGEIAMEITGLSCRRKRTEVLRVEHLAVPNHAVVGIVGENGAGKSTFAECISGLLRCRGQIRVKGLNTRKKERIKNSYIVMQDVNYQLFCGSVSEEITLGSGSGRKEKETELLAQMDLLPLREKHPASLSGGQKQRVAICAAICAEKQWMFYDEPTSGLDYEGMRRFCALLGEYRETVLVSWVITHDLELLMGSCTHILHLEGGRVKGFYPLDREHEDRLKRIFTEAVTPPESDPQSSP